MLVKFLKKKSLLGRGRVETREGRGESRDGKGIRGENREEERIEIKRKHSIREVVSVQDLRSHHCAEQPHYKRGLHTMVCVVRNALLAGNH